MCSYETDAISRLCVWQPYVAIKPRGLMSRTPSPLSHISPVWEAVFSSLCLWHSWVLMCNPCLWGRLRDGANACSPSRPQQPQPSAFSRIRLTNRLLDGLRSLVQETEAQYEERAPKCWMKYGHHTVTPGPITADSQRTESVSVLRFLTIWWPFFKGNGFSYELLQSDDRKLSLAQKWSNPSMNLFHIDTIFFTPIRTRNQQGMVAKCVHEVFSHYKQEECSYENI